MISRNWEILENLQRDLNSTKLVINWDYVLEALEELEKSEDSAEGEFQKACGYFLVCGYYWNEAEHQFQKALEKNPHLRKTRNNLKILEEHKKAFKHSFQQLEF